MAQNAGSATPQQLISRGVVSIYKEYLGRGPTHAVTEITPGFVTTICRDGLTKAEQRLVAHGDLDTVRGMRRKFQIVMSSDITQLVEEHTGLKAVTLLSDHDVETDIAIEVVIVQNDTSYIG